MKHSVFYHPLIKTLCLLVCIASFLFCAYSGLRLIWMDENEVFSGDYSPRIVDEGFSWPFFGGWYGRTVSDTVTDGIYYYDTFSERLYRILVDTIDAGVYPAKTVKDSASGTVYPVCAAEEALALLERYRKDNSNFVFRITDNFGNVIFSNMEDLSPETDVEYGQSIPFFIDYSVTAPVEEAETDGIPEQGEADTAAISEYRPEYDDAVIYYHAEDGYTPCTLMYGVRAGCPVDDEYAAFFGACEKDHAMAAQWFLLFGGSALLALGSLILVLLGAGIRCREEGVHLMPFDRLPLELSAIIKGALMVVTIALIVEMTEWESMGLLLAVLFGYLPPSVLPGLSGLILIAQIFCVFAVLLIGIWILCGMVRRIKSRTFFDNTVIGRCILFLLRILRKFCGWIRQLAENIPVLWKWLAAFGGVMLLSFFGMMFAHFDFFLFIIWGIAGTALAFFGCRFLIETERVRTATATIASGRLDTKVDTASMHGMPRQTAENLNRIGDAMSIAVDERMKSERFRTELITNVSHDIKTPLTSIINYTDLLSRENPENERMREYIDVLSRQSARLKKLIEDLLEASKASSGTVSVTLADTDAGELLSQAAGEYAERFAKAELTPVLKTPEIPMIIRADGRHLWRVFDNLFSNICKYSMPGTRVYLSAEREKGIAVLTFRNISSEELNVSADELTERFVRGDRSRHTEGSGLGLAIAKSLTELQGGEFALSADGDLFKVTIRFPLAETGKV